MKTITSICLLFASVLLFSQTTPTHLEHESLSAWENFVSPPSPSGFYIPEPPAEPVRHMAEWEELDAIVVTWKSFKDILVEIIRHAKEEVKVYIVVNSDNAKMSAENKLLDNGVELDNIEFVVQLSNSVWIRDYGHTPVYSNEVGDQLFIDWIYNRSDRPQDDVVPNALSDQLGIPLHSTTEGEYKLVHIGGNFQSDGMGTGFSSDLILDENGPGNIFNVGPLTEAGVDNIMYQFHGIDHFIKFEKLQYDAIHHLDMHARILDEETWLFGEYPEGVADGPTIEDNIEYVEGELSTFGTNYRIERILMPPDEEGKYPDEGGKFRTYTNFVFINKTILVPFYEATYDSMAMEVFERLFPGYKIVGIDCNEMIQFYGALHCITKEIGAKNPLWIVHQRQRDIYDNEDWSGYPISAQIKHRYGVVGAELYWTTDLEEGYELIEMEEEISNSDRWSALIPHQPNGTEIFYYIKGYGSTGKTQVRPLPAPAGYYHFTVNDGLNSVEENQLSGMGPIAPNPTDGLFVIPLEISRKEWASVKIFDLNGRLKQVVFEGVISPGKHSLSFDVGHFSAGTYLVQFMTEKGVGTKKLIVK